MWFLFDIIHVPGKHVVDTLSCAPVEPANPDADLLDEVEAFMHATVASLPATSQRLTNIALAQSDDGTCSQVIKYALDGWLAKATLCGTIRDYSPYSASFTVATGGLLLLNSRIVIPEQLRSNILSRLHEGHQGITKCRRIAFHTVWWPNLSTDISNFIDACSVYAKSRQQPVEPLIPSSLLDLPWSSLAADVFRLSGKNYLLVVNCYSHYVGVAHMTTTSASATITQLKGIFNHHGIPSAIFTDNGPQFTAS